MQQDAQLMGLLREVRLLGINQIGAEGGNAEICAGRTIPWLQDVPAVAARTSWAPTYRDVVILDDQNIPVAVYNLTVHDLQNPANFAELRSLLIFHATGPHPTGALAQPAGSR